MSVGRRNLGSGVRVGKEESGKWGESRIEWGEGRDECRKESVKRGGSREEGI